MSENNKRIWNEWFIDGEDDTKYLRFVDDCNDYMGGEVQFYKFSYDTASELLEHKLNEQLQRCLPITITVGSQKIEITERDITVDCEMYNYRQMCDRWDSEIHLASEWGALEEPILLEIKQRLDRMIEEEGINHNNYAQCEFCDTCAIYFEELDPKDDRFQNSLRVLWDNGCVWRKDTKYDCFEIQTRKDSTADEIREHLRLMEYEPDDIGIEEFALSTPRQLEEA